MDGSSTMSELKLSRDDVARLRTAIRTMDAGAGSMEGVAECIVRHLYDNLLVAGTSERACALVRFFKTHPFSGLDHELKQLVVERLGEPPKSSQMPCLTLLASAGVKPEWNSRQTSIAHRVIPLASPEFVQRVPMIAQLFLQLGIDIKTIIEPDPAMLVDMEGRTYNVFFVEQAENNPHVPDQEHFVRPYGIKSVLGFGGMLPLGSVFAIIIFATAPIKRETAQMFVPLAVGMKIPLLTFAGKRLFS